MLHTQNEKLQPDGDEPTKAVSTTKTTLREHAETDLSPIEDLVADVAAGKMVVLVDDEDRENEGDLVMAAEAATAADINFMITQGRGLVCVPMPAAHAEQLRLHPMVHTNQDDFGTAFTVSCDATSEFGVTTGISASDRARTIQLLASGGTSESFHRPGHVFPLIARDGGVLTRVGHTEAASDIAAMAGFSPVGVIIEIIGDDGEMLRLPQLILWCRQRGIAISTIERMRAYRREQMSAGVRIDQKPDGSPIALNQKEGAQ